MPSVSQVGTSLPNNQLLSNQPTNYLLTVKEVINNFHDNDPLLGNRQQYNKRANKKGSKPSSSVTSYKNNTDDSGMSTGNSSNFLEGVQIIPETDEKFVARAVSPQSSAVSMHSGHNSTASSCWKFQKSSSNNEKIQQPNFNFNKNFYKTQKAANFKNNFQEKIKVKPELFTGKC